MRGFFCAASTHSSAPRARYTKRMQGEFLYYGIYVLQQLGVMLGVGAQTVLLCAHLVAVHRREVELPHASFARAARSARMAGFVLIIVSGVAAVAVHVLNQETQVLLAPAFLFKWVLVFGVLGVFVVEQWLVRWSSVLQGFAGATWYAIFLVHSIAPVTSWLNLGVLYIAWLATFALLWTAFLLIMRWRRAPSAPAPAPVVAIKKEVKFVPPVVLPPLPPPTPPKPIPPPAPTPPKATQGTAPPKPEPLMLAKPITLPVVPQPVVAAPLAPAAAPAANQGDLPALRIMPQTPGDIARHDRPAVIKSL